MYVVDHIVLFRRSALKYGCDFSHVLKCHPFDSADNLCLHVVTPTNLLEGVDIAMRFPLNARKHGNQHPLQNVVIAPSIFPCVAIVIEFENSRQKARNIVFVYTWSGPDLWSGPSKKAPAFSFSNMTLFEVMN